MRFSIDEYGAPEPVIAPAVCRRIRIHHVGYRGNSVFYVYRNGITDPEPVELPPNLDAEFTRSSFFQPGEIVGYAALATGGGTEDFDMECFDL